MAEHELNDQELQDVSGGLQIAISKKYTYKFLCEKCGWLSETYSILRGGVDTCRKHANIQHHDARHCYEDLTLLEETM